MECTSKADGIDASAQHARHLQATAEPSPFQCGHFPVTVLLVDDHEVVRAGCRIVLESSPDIVVAAEAENGEIGCALYRKHAPDVVLLDLNMPGIDGIETARRIKAHDPRARILIFSSHTDTHIIQRARAAGAIGYLNKRDSQKMVGAVLKTARGGMSWI